MVAIIKSNFCYIVIVLSILLCSTVSGQIINNLVRTEESTPLKIAEITIITHLNVDGSLFYEETIGLVYYTTLDRNCENCSLIVRTHKFPLPRYSIFSPGLKVSDVLTGDEFKEVYYFESLWHCDNEYIFNRTDNTLELCTSDKKQIKVKITGLILPVLDKPTSDICTNLTDKIYNNIVLLLPSTDYEYFTSISTLGGDDVLIDSPPDSCFIDYNGTQIGQLKYIPLYNGDICQGNIEGKNFTLGFNLTSVGYNQRQIQARKDAELLELQRQSMNASIIASNAAEKSASYTLVLAFFTLLLAIATMALAVHSWGAVNEAKSNVKLTGISIERGRKKYLLQKITLLVQYCDSNILHFEKLNFELMHNTFELANIQNLRIWENRYTEGRLDDVYQEFLSDYPDIQKKINIFQQKRDKLNLLLTSLVKIFFTEDYTKYYNRAVEDFKTEGMSLGEYEHICRCAIRVIQKFLMTAVDYKDCGYTLSQGGPEHTNKFWTVVCLPQYTKFESNDKSKKLRTNIKDLSEDLKKISEEIRTSLVDIKTNLSKYYKISPDEIRDVSNP